MTTDEGPTMTWRREGSRAADELWRVAESVPLFRADTETVVRLAREAGLGEQQLDAVLVAERHPTGWFVHAACRRGLSPEAYADLRELVTVRAYALLRHGPVPQVWSPVGSGCEWRSVAVSMTQELAALARELRP